MKLQSISLPGLGDAYPTRHLTMKVISIFKIKITQKCDLENQDHDLDLQDHDLIIKIGPISASW